MSKKANILATLEKHVDKIILGVIFLVGLGLLWKFVLSNPYGAAVRIDGRQTSVKPGTIDQRLKSDAEELLQSLQQPPEAAEYDIYSQNEVAAYIQKLQAAIPDVLSLPIPYPGVGDAQIEEDRVYAIPTIPALENVEVAMLRGAAQVPVEEVSPGTPYESAESEIRDIDVVTVSARFDMERLYNNFQLSFNNPGMKSSWRSNTLAQPVLARLELQRREQLQGGSFSEWITVPRAITDAYKKLLEELPLRADQMQFGVDVWMSQFQSPAVQLDILQPQAYQFEISRVDWMPPEFLLETYEIIQREEEQQRREAIEARRRARETEDRTNARPGGVNVRQNRRTGVPDRGEDMMAERQQPRRIERTRQDVERDMQRAMLRSTAQLNNLQEPVLVWVYDDTVQPGKTYQYRIRIGVFNPITGKDWFYDDQLAYKDQTVFWSDFSIPTNEIKVPKMLHVFPIDPLTVALEDGTKAVKGVKVEVAKYNMGRWRMHEFDVYPGQPIGHSVEPTESKTQLRDNRESALDPRLAGRMLQPGTDGERVETQKIDYSSGMTMVDVVEQASWEISLRRSDYYAMLYQNGDSLAQMNIGRSNWPQSIRTAYAEIQDAMEDNTDLKDQPTDRGRMPYGRAGFEERMR